MLRFIKSQLFRQLRQAFPSVNKATTLLMTLFLFAFTAMGQNAIATENALVGNPRSEWDIVGAGDLTIQGFATEMSVNKGKKIKFKIQTDANAYTVDIYRLGYYGGMGARKVGTGVISAVLPQIQPAPLTNTSTGLVDCGNWKESASWDVPANAVSGVYIAKLTRATGGSSHITFVVRDDASMSDLLFQTSDQTWQAVNNYGGYDFFSGTTAWPSGRAVKLSYNRPLLTRSSGAEDGFFNAEYPMIRWLERNGYDVSYMSGVDVEIRGNLLLNHKLFLSVGHDEFWSREQRDNVTNARNAGKHLAFFSGNSVYWKTRWENSVDGINSPYRTLVCYKEGTSGACTQKCDPVLTSWTGLWRNGCNFPAADGCRPENALSGQLGVATGTDALDVPASLKNLRFWRNTSITSLATNQNAFLTTGSLGHMFDYEQTSNAYPLGRVMLSKTVVAGRTHNMTFYKHNSGAIVFGAGSTQYSWGLDSVHDRGNARADVRLQQATVNLFADMGVPARTIQPDLVQTTASADVTAPVSVFTFPTTSTIGVQGKSITVRGTSSDIGGVVGAVMVSFDNGVTWKLASGTTSWSISWTPALSGAITLKVIGVDDTGNLESVSSSNTITIQVATAGPAIEGSGGPILLVSNAANPYSKYSKEIMQAQGFNEYYALDITQINTDILNKFDIVVLGHIPLTPAQVTVLSDWTNLGGTLVSFRPSLALSGLMGLTAKGDSLSNKYLKVNTAGGPGSGIVGETIQYHGAADLYTLNGATAIATLYTNATTASTNPAVTINNVGTNGGQAIAFTYDLARSVVYTRQGNPAWAAQERDGSAPIRSNDMFTGVGEPDWIDFDKIAIPQADEQMHLLTNIMLIGNIDRKPLPRFWFLPKGLKAAIVMTGDDHAFGGTVGRFNQYLSLSNSNTATAIADWDAIRGTSYIYTNTPISDSLVKVFQNKGFEIALHLSTSCADFTLASLDADFSTQLAAGAVNYPGMRKPATNRTHCIPWSDWSTHAELQASKGIRFDVNYYYWPGSWVQNRSGFFTGSGFPMKFAKQTGSIIDCYQAPTQLSDETNLDYTNFTNELLDKAIGSEGYYGVFVTNMHTDFVNSPGSDAIIASAKNHGVPVVSSLQMLNWLDGRNNSTFTDMVWNANQLSFNVTAATGSRNMETMVPMNANALRLSSVNLNGGNVSYRMEMIKGIQYAFFRVVTGNYVVNYSTVPPCIPPESVISSPAIVCPGQPIPLTLVSSSGQSPFSLTVNGTNYNNVIPGQVFAAATFTENSIWPNTSVPAIPAITDNIPIETGVKFRANTDGHITGIRFYKGVGNTGTHTATLWNSAGVVLATATFTGETASGWQTVRFGTPVNITANTTYIASNFSPDGYYSYTGGYFGSPSVTGPLTALQNGSDGPNGVYKYGGGFPDGGNGANYWVDVLFKPSTSATTKTYVLTNVIDNFGCSNFGTLSSTSTAISPLPSGSIALSNPTTCKNDNVFLTFNATIGTGPFSLKVNNTAYNNITSGVPFNTNVVASTAQSSFWTNTTTPGANSNDAAEVELGLKFRSTIPGTIRSIRFYKYSNNTGTHTASLWTSAGTLLATATFTNETTEGWQQVDFATPVSILANTTYIASYHTTTGNYAFTSPGFNTTFTNGPLSAPGGSNGVYKYGIGFPNQSYNSTNYWIDVVLESNGSRNFNLSSITDVNGCTSTANFGTVSMTPVECAPPVTTVLKNNESLQNSSTEIKYELGQNFPNPFSRTTNINYSIASPGKVSIRLYDASGRLVKILAQEMRPAGKHQLSLNTLGMSSGVYFYRMEAGSFRSVKRMTIQ